VDLRGGGRIRARVFFIATRDSPRGDIDELISLGEIGHVRRILEKLLEIENVSPQYGNFVAQMRTIINAFDLKRYAAALEAIRSRHA
jgi:hypothetical protein